MKKTLFGVLLGVIVMAVIGGALVVGEVVAFDEETAIPEHAHDSLTCYDNSATAASSTHQHEMLMLTEEDTIPSVEIEVTPDAKSGYNVRIMTENFTFAPEHASSEHVDGEGHAHLYIDDVKIGRVYGEWVYVGALTPGLHEIKVTLNANNHADFMVDGNMIADAVVILVEE